MAFRVEGSHGENQLPKKRSDPLGETWGTGGAGGTGGFTGRAPGTSARLGVSCWHAASGRDSGDKAPQRQRVWKPDESLHTHEGTSCSGGGPPPPA